MKHLSVVIISAIVLLFSGNITAQSSDYIIKRGDVIDILVMDHDEFTITGINVLPDGTVQYPGFGSVVVAGMATQQLSDTLQTILERYIVQPIISVFVRRLHDQMLNVLGHVRRPGQYQVFEPIDLYAALGRGGGIIDLRRVRGIYIIRSDQTVVEVASNRFEVRRLFVTRGGGWQEVPFLYAGDTLYVQEPRDINWGRLSFFASLSTTVMYFLRYFVL